MLSVLLYGASMTCMIFDNIFASLAAAIFGMAYYFGSVIDVFRFGLKLNLLEAVFMVLATMPTILIAFMVGLIICCFDGF